MSNDAPARPLPTPGAVGAPSLTSPAHLVPAAGALAPGPQRRQWD